MEPTRRRLRAESDDPVVQAVDALTDMLEAEVTASQQDRAQRAGGNGGVYIPKWVAIAVFGFFLTAVTALAGTVLNMRTELAVIRGNRFTASDALRLQAEIMSEIPPEDVERRLGEHERRLDRIENGNQGGNE